MGERPSIMFVLGTRPEAVKLAPVIHAARAFADWRVVVCSTGQHKELLAPFLDVFGLVPDIELGVMVPGQGLGALLGLVVTAVERTLLALRPAWIVVQGDTTTVLGAALAAAQVAPQWGLGVAHVEAGLRTHDRSAPFPEETNRVLVGQLATLHLCPSTRAVENLVREGAKPEQIVLTGNTVVDAVRWIRARLPEGGRPPEEITRVLPRLRDTSPMVLVTGHRREAFDGGLARRTCAPRSIARSPMHPTCSSARPSATPPRCGSSSARGSSSPTPGASKKKRPSSVVPRS
jgi:UDP-N-acetylglucosamine 2-epimerase (non-hydrolysing)